MNYPSRTFGRHLNLEEVVRYEREGFLAPIEALTASEAVQRLDWLCELEAQHAGRITPTHNIKIHLLVPWLWDLVHNPRILDPVEDLLGPDLLCWGASFFDKRPGESHHVPWHQDASYWGLSAPDALTAWVAFTPSLRENGCMRISPRTHRSPIRHIDTHDRTNMLPGREALAADVDEGTAVDIELQSGEMSLHHVLTVHGSKPNLSAQRRCGFAIRYISGRVKTVRGTPATAALVRGRDHGHFELEAEPEGVFHPDAVARYQSVLRIWMRNVFDEIKIDRSGAKLL
jgi:non-haem Fe2+, alpha-ketoglutarate-dependent halogenase